MTGPTQGERITALEVEVRSLKAIIEEQIDAHKRMDEKLDSLISLRDKGAGAFWLGATLFGGSLVGFLYAILHWAK